MILAVMKAKKFAEHRSADVQPRMYNAVVYTNVLSLSPHVRQHRTLAAQTEDRTSAAPTEPGTPVQRINTGHRSAVFVQGHRDDIRTFEKVSPP